VFSALIDAIDERADFVQAQAEHVEAMAEKVVAAIDLAADGTEIEIEFLPELGEFLAGEELSFQRGFANELLAERHDGKDSGGGSEPVGEVDWIWSRELGQEGFATEGSKGSKGGWCRTGQTHMPNAEAAESRHKREEGDGSNFSSAVTA